MAISAAMWKICRVRVATLRRPETDTAIERVAVGTKSHRRAESMLDGFVAISATFLYGDAKQWFDFQQL